ncbi:hypothetical protein JCM8097_004837 [Rhodosporidiobolus ruineniae]
MLSLASRAFRPAARVAARHTPQAAPRRLAHFAPENTMGTAFPWDYTGKNGYTRFTVVYWGLLGGVGLVGVPALAFFLQQAKFKGTL